MGKYFFATVFVLAATCTTWAQAPPERMRDLSEDQAAGKVRWLAAKWVSGEIDRAEATKGILEAFEHPWIGVRLVVFDYIDRLDPVPTKLALGAQLRQFNVELAQFDGPSGPLTTGKDVTGHTAVCLLAFIRPYAMALFTAIGRMADDTLVGDLCSFGERAHMRVLLEVAPPLVDCLLSIGTQTTLDRAIALYDKIESVLLPILRLKINVAKMDIYLRTWPIEEADDYLRGLHAKVGRAFSQEHVVLPKFKLTAASAPEFRKLAKANRKRFPERLGDKKPTADRNAPPADAKK